jgi:hypothetical protein
LKLAVVFETLSTSETEMQIARPDALHALVVEPATVPGPRSAATRHAAKAEPSASRLLAWSIG